jgi:hypothetical protein
MFLFSSIASAGTVDPGDLSNVACEGSRVQLRPSDVLSRDGLSSATIRYAVSPSAIPNGQEVGQVMLVIRLQPGGGRVLATFMEARIDPAQQGDVQIPDPGIVSEAKLIEFDSAAPNTAFPIATDTFQTLIALPVSPASSHRFNTELNAYYIALTLSTPTGPHPTKSFLLPAVSAVAIATATG